MQTIIQPGYVNTSSAFDSESVILLDVADNFAVGVSIIKPGSPKGERAVRIGDITVGELKRLLELRESGRIDLEKCKCGAWHDPEDFGQELEETNPNVWARVCPTCRPPEGQDKLEGQADQRLSDPDFRISDADFDPEAL